MFAAAGWQVVTVKWGRLISGLFQRNGGAELRARLETMPNEEYQRMLRVRPAEIRDRIIATSGSDELRTLLSTIDSAELAVAIRDLGGHDLGLLVDTFRSIDSLRPTIVFALHDQGPGAADGGTSEQPLRAADRCADADPGLCPARWTQPGPWQHFDPGTPAGQLCDRRARQLHRDPVTPSRLVAIPASLGHPHRKPVSTQAALGRFLADLAHDAPEAAARVVTCSPDVASSTNLGGWINKTGVWSVQDRHDWFADDSERVLRWREVSNGQHIELGIAEVNLVSLLGELGATWSRWGERLIPLATLYDPFVSRALEPWSYGIYSGGQSILVGTPSGVTLAPEGGAHQSVTTPSIGLEQPGCIAWEPAFAQDLEWCLLHAMERVGVPGGTSCYFRLSTRPIDPALAQVPAEPALAERRRQQALAGGYRMPAEHPGEEEDVTLVGVGAIMPEAIAAAAALAAEGVNAGVICLTSPDLVFRAFQQRGRRKAGVGGNIADELFPVGHPAPLVTVLDGHPHTLAFLAGLRGDRLHGLGVTEFGQSSSLDDAYRIHHIDTGSIVDAALTMVGR